MRHLLLAAAILAPTALAAQANPDARTLGWQVRGDRPTTDASVLSFVEMKPGFHVTTNRFSGILYHPGMTGTGTYEALMKVYFFKPQSDHHEAYGLFVGGKDLAGEGINYTYFLIRNDGSYLIKRREGATTRDVVGWTKHEAIKVRPATAADTETALNELIVRATDDAVAFLINGTVVATRPRAELGADGVVGIRANHFLDLHVSAIEVSAPGKPAGE